MLYYTNVIDEYTYSKGNKKKTLKGSDKRDFYSFIMENFILYLEKGEYKKLKNNIFNTKIDNFFELITKELKIKKLNVKLFYSKEDFNTFIESILKNRKI
jgi:hypothetical protein